MLTLSPYFCPGVDFECYILHNLSTVPRYAVQAKYQSLMRSESESTRQRFCDVEFYIIIMYKYLH